MNFLAESIFDKGQRALKPALVAFLLLLLSGFLPISVQCYAWIRMADKAGGVEKLSEVVISAPSCEICCAASELQEKLRGEKGKRGADDRWTSINHFTIRF